MSEIIYKKKRRLYLLAKRICAVLNPFLIPIYLVLILIYTSKIYTVMDFNFKSVLLCFILLSVLCAPLVILIVLKRFKIISSYNLDNKQNKTNILTFVILYYALMQIFVVDEVYIYFITRIFTAVNLIAIITATISYIWKINIYTVALGALAAIIHLLGYSGFSNIDAFFIISVLCLGIAGSATMFLKKNNLVQTFVGMVVGFITMFALAIW